MITGATRVFAVLGRPVGHSRSPELHNAWLREHGVDGVYVALDVPPDRADHVVDGLRTLGLAGANVTVPLKQAVVAGMDALSPMARRLGSVNTIVREGERLVGHTTDGVGFVQGLRHDTGRDVAGMRALVLGAGGAGIAVAAGLLEAGAARVDLLNRTVARAEGAAARCAGLGSIGVGALTPEVFAGLAPSADLIVVAVSGPGRAAVAACDPSHVRRDAVWADLNYWQDDPPLAASLVHRGVTLHGGLPMLVFQAAEAFRLLTGISPDAGRTLERIG